MNEMFDFSVIEQLVSNNIFLSLWILYGLVYVGWSIIDYGRMHLSWIPLLILGVALGPVLSIVEILRKINFKSMPGKVGLFFRRISDAKITIHFSYWGYLCLVLASSCSTTQPDPAPDIEGVYYKLYQVDYDGASEEFDVIYVYNYKYNGTFVSNVMSEVNEDDPDLPIELLYFGGRFTDDGVYLEYATASEINSDYVEILGSVDGYSWLSVVKIPSECPDGCEYNHYDNLLWTK